MKISYFVLLCGALSGSLRSSAQTDTTVLVSGDSAIIHATPVLTAADTTIRYRINGTYLLSAWQDLKYSVSKPLHWKRKDFLKLGAVVGGAGVLMAADYEIKQAFLANRQPFWTSVTDQIEPFGNTYSPFLVGGMYLTGVVTKNRALEHTSLMTAKSLLISTMIYTFSKAMIRRGRPTHFDDPFLYKEPLTMDKKYTSFPSGHMLTVTSVATALAEAYGEDYPWVPYVSYGIAILTGSTRLYQARHWSSDVWVGASLGYFVTKGIFKRHKALEHKKAMAAMAAAAGR